MSVHPIGCGWEEGLDRSGAVAHTSCTPGTSHYGKEEGSTSRYNTEQAIQAATTLGQAYPQMDRGRIGAEGNKVAKECSVERKGAVEPEAAGGEGGVVEATGETHKNIVA
mgnify:CR=1 FL=1